MMDRKAIRGAMGKYTRLRTALAKSASVGPRQGYVADISGTFVDHAIAEDMLEHLRKCLPFDEEDDAIRLVLASELWGLNRMPEALAEYERIVRRDSMQSVVAQRMIEEIRKRSS